MGAALQLLEPVPFSLEFYMDKGIFSTQSLFSPWERYKKFVSSVQCNSVCFFLNASTAFEKL